MFNLKFLFLFSLAVWRVNSLQGGTNAVLGQFPSFITVFVPAPTTICGGAILNANHVLTLAMCMLNANLLLHPANQVGVLAGLTTLNMTAPRILANAIYVHPQYNPFTFDSDIAVIRLQTNFIFPTIPNPPSAIGLLNDQIVFDTQPCNLAAWNRNNNLQQTILPPIVNRDQCTELAVNQGRITEAMLCAGVLTAGPGVCNHNIGAVLYCNGAITGLLNSGYGCGAANFPGTYIQTRFFNEWIQDQMRRQDIPLANSFPLENLP